MERWRSCHPSKWRLAVAAIAVAGFRGCVACYTQKIAAADRGINAAILLKSQSCSGRIRATICTCSSLHINILSQCGGVLRLPVLTRLSLHYCIVRQDVDRTLGSVSSSLRGLIQAPRDSGNTKNSSTGQCDTCNRCSLKRISMRVIAIVAIAITFALLVKGKIARR